MTGGGGNGGGIAVKISFANCPEMVMMQCLFDSLSLSRYGESSGELSSVMILNPITGNNLEKAVGQDTKTSYEQ
jgi:hypothetical protein